MLVLKKNIMYEIDMVVKARQKRMYTRIKASAKKISRFSFNVKSHIRRDRHTNKITHIGFTLDTYGVFVEKGVGRGRGINSDKKKPQPWFNPIIEEEVPLLADEISLAVEEVLKRTLIL